MLIRRGVSWVSALLLALVALIVVEPTTANAAVTIPVSAANNVRAQLALHYGSKVAGLTGTVNYSAYDCARLGSETGTGTSGTVSNTGGVAVSSATTGNTQYVQSGSSVWVAHGAGSYTTSNRVNYNTCPTLLDFSQQSAVGFAPASVTSLTPGTIFNLGRIAHRNTGIYLQPTDNEYFRGNLNLQFMGMGLSYTYEMHETPGTGVADTTTFLTQVSDQAFTHDGLRYTLVVRGFTSAGSGNTCTATVGSLNSVTSTFTTAEDATTWGCLYAQIQQVRSLTVAKQIAAPYGAPATYPQSNFTGTSSVSGSPWASTFGLTPTGTGVAGQAATTRDLVTGQQITVAEDTPTGADWSFTSLSCVDGAGNTATAAGSSIPGLTVANARIALSGDYSTDSASAAPITCTYVNTYTPHATLTLVKQVDSTNQPGTKATAADWTLSASGTGAVSGQTVSGTSGGSQVTSRSVIAGSYDLAEVAANPTTTAGYVQDGAWSCTAGTLSGNRLTLAAGQSATCTVRNVFAVGSLAITKTVTGDGYTAGAAKGFSATYTCTSGTATVASGTVTLHAGATNGTAGAAQTIANIPAGATCAVVETNVPTGSTDLRDGSWTWGTPVNPAAVTITRNTTATVNITNSTAQQFGSFQISAAVSPRSGVPGAGYSGGAERTFPVTYSCTLGGTVVSSGTVDVSTGTPRTISGIPASSTCAVTGEDQAAKSGDFADASYAWDGYTASTAATIAANGTGTVTVTNHFRRDLVTLHLAAAVSGSGYAGSGADFAIAYDCGAPYAGTVHVAAGGSQGVTVPAGVACTVAEEPPAHSLLRAGYVWGDPAYAGLTGGQVTVPSGGSSTVTVTNPTSIGYGRIQVAKQVADFRDRVASGTAFSVRVSCDAAAQGASGDYAETFSLVWPSATTALTPYLPVGTSCTVTETDAPTGHTALPDASYAWRAAPEPATVKVPASEDPRNVDVTNDVRRVYATFRVATDLVNHTGHDASGEHFTGSWTCDYNGGETTRSGSWGVTGQGTAETVDVLVGSVCTVTQNGQGAPVPGDRSYTWTSQVPGAVTVGGDGATATVVNTLNRAQGSFSVAKSVTGGEAGEAFASGADFSFSFSCTPLTGDVITGSLTVHANDSAAPSVEIPGGSTCTVTEGDFPGAIDPYRWDDVHLGVDGDASHGGQNGRSITFTTTDDAAPVAVRAVNTLSPRTASVRVTKAVSGETAGYTGGSFPVTLRCDGAVVGTRDVAPGDAATWDGIPVGAKCSVTEGSTADALRDGSYAWGEPTIGDAVKLTDPGTFEIAVTNPIRRVFAAVEAAVVVDDNGYAGVLDPEQPFTGTWSCRYGDDDPVTGTWQALGSSTGIPVALSDHILVGSRCTITQDTPSAPSSDPSYRWDATPELHGVTVAAGEPNRLSVTNTLRRDTGKVTATVELSGETAGYDPSGGFDGFSITARCYLADPDEAGHLEQTVTIRPGDSRAVIDGVPHGWTCTLSEGAFPVPSQLRDASYAWDSQSIAFGSGHPTVTVTAENDHPQATATYGIRRVTGHLAITKAFGDGTADAVRAGTTFTGAYRCTYGSDRYTGTWTVTGAGPATLTGDGDIPLTAECSVTEDDPSDAALLDSSYTWARPDLAEPVAVLSAAEPAQLTVTNTATRRWSGLEVSTSYDGPSGAFAADLAVTGTWQCVYRDAVVASGSWSLPAGGGHTVVATPADEAIPAASVCTVTQHSLPADQLTDTSYAWGTETYSPADGSVTTAAGETAHVTVANTVARVRAPFGVTKYLDLGTGVERSALEADLAFSGTYRCTHRGDDPVTGTWGPVAAGDTWTGPDVLVGSSCRVTAEADRPDPSRGDDSYLWGDPVLGDAVVVAAPDEARASILVTNPVIRITGSFGVTKVVTGDTEGIDRAASFGFGWQCTARNGDTFPGTEPGRFALTAGNTWNAPDTVPAGSSCWVSEDASPAASDPSYGWSTSFDVLNATGTSSGKRTTFTLPKSGDPVSVTVTNTLTRTKGSFTISKSADPGDGATVVPGQPIHYTVRIHPAAIGFTRDVVVTDALAGVLAHATVSDIAASQGSAELVGDNLVWTAGTVQAGTDPVLTYTATVNADAVGVDIANRVSATGEVRPPACDEACTTTHHTAAWSLTKTSDPASGTVVEPGRAITYTLTATNEGNGVVSGATAVDDLSGLAADITFSSAELSLSGDGVLTWAVPRMTEKGETRTVTYTATVRAGADGVTLRNQAVPQGAGALSCAAACTTTHTTASWTLAKSASAAAGAVVAPGDRIAYTLTVTNTGPAELVGARVLDDISDLVDDATLATPLPEGLTRSGDRLTWAVPDLAPGAGATIEYAVVVRDPGATLRNTATAATPGGHCADTCETVQYTPSWRVTKASDPVDGVVAPGDLITYTLTVENTGPATLTGAVVADDLADVVDDGDLVVVPDGASLDADNVLTWSVPDVASRGTASLQYQVRVTKDGASLVNTATAVGTGGTCATCTTRHDSPAWRLTKASDAGAVAEPGDVIAYTLTAENTSATPVVGATATDDLTSVLAAADVDLASDQLTRTGTTLTWAIPDLAPGQTRTVTYTATVRESGRTITNTAMPHGQGGSCVAASDCTTTTATPQWLLAKTSDAGQVVNPGDPVRYTLTVSNPGPAPVSGATVVDDISGILAGATLVEPLPDGLTRTAAGTLTWAVPTVPVGGHAEVTYTATVQDDAVGATLHNVATPGSGTSGGRCDDACATTSYTPAWTLTKRSDVGPGATIEPGRLIGYELTVQNSDLAPLAGARVVDDLSGVLDHATLVAVPDGATVSADHVLTWAVPTTPAGASATLRYQVRVADDAVGETLTNTARPDSAGGSCDAAADCTIVAHTPAWTLEKVSDPVTGVTVSTGGTITYRLIARNTSDAEIRGALAVDDLSQVAPYADITFDSDQLSRSADGRTLTWAIPTLAKGEWAEVTYTATVRDGQDGVTVANSVRAVGAGASCIGGCATTHSTVSWNLAKTSDAPAVVQPGALIRYTLRVTNTGPVPVTDALVSDDLGEVVDDAVVSDLGPGLTRPTSRTLLWMVPDVPVGGWVTVDYYATVAAGSTGATLTNTAATASSGGRCVACTTTSTTPGWELAKRSDVGDGATVAPGSPISYTLRVTNTGPAPLTGARVSDDVTDIDDDATLVLPAGLTRTGEHTLTWAVPEVPVGGFAEISYTADVRENATGATLRNTARPDASGSAGGSCASAAACTTTAYTGAWELEKTSDAPAVVAPGDVITYTLTATNRSSAVVSGAQATDDLSGVVDDATVSFASDQLSRVDDTLTWAIPTLAPGAHASVTYTAVVRADGATITNTAAPVGDAGACTSCTTTSSTPAWELQKSSDRSAVVAPGDVITYTLSVRNTGPVPVTGAVVSDDLSGLGGHVTLTGDLADGLASSGDELTWLVPTVPVGGTVTVSYTVAVGVDALGVTLTNRASASTASTSGGSCATCEVTHITPKWSLAKTSTAAAGATVNVDDEVGYALTVTNDGPAPLTGATVTDDLADVLDDATLVEVPAGATLDGTTLTWSVPAVAPGATTTLEYLVRVTRSGATLHNVARPTSVGGSCPETCETTAFTPAWTLAKLSDAASVVVRGDVVTWTLVARNTSSAVVAGALASDDLADVLDDATLRPLPSGLELAGATLTWHVPTLQPGDEARVSYSARVARDGATLTNTVVPVGAGGACTVCSTTSHGPAWTLAKASDQPENAVLEPGDEIGYTLTVTNTGPIPLVGAQVRDDVADVLDDAYLATLPAGLSLSGDTLTWAVPDVPVGGTASVQYTATVSAWGATVQNTAAPATPGGSCLACTTTQYSPRWTLAKSSDAPESGIVQPGSVITYTLTVGNTGPVVLTGAQVRDDLSGVLDDATLVAVPEGATLEGTTLVWSLPEVAVDGSVRLTYQVRLADDARGATLHNVAAPATGGGSCSTACETTAYTTAWSLAKTSDPGDGATVVPGDEITYTLRATNTGPVVLTGAVVDDNMSDLLDDADLVGGLPAGTSRSGDRLTWRVPDVPVGGSAEVHYTVKVKADAYGATLANVASGVGATSCAIGGIGLADLDATSPCRTRQYSPGWSLEKTSDPGNGATVVPGSDVTYTLRVRNTSRAVVRDAVVTDDLAEVLAYARLSGGLPAGATLTGSVLTWTVPTLQPGEVAEVSYTVTVRDDDEAYNGHFTNTAVPGAGGSCVTCTSALDTSPAVVDPIEDEDGDGGSTGGAHSGSDVLAYTGSDLAVLGLAAVALAAGAGLLAAARRRRREEP